MAIRLETFFSGPKKSLKTPKTPFYPPPGFARQRSATPSPVTAPPPRPYTSLSYTTEASPRRDYHVPAPFMFYLIDSRHSHRPNPYPPRWRFLSHRHLPFRRLLQAYQILISRIPAHYRQKRQQVPYWVLLFSRILLQADGQLRQGCHSQGRWWEMPYWLVYVW